MDSHVDTPSNLIVYYKLRYTPPGQTPEDLSGSEYTEENPPSGKYAHATRKRDPPKDSSKMKAVLLGCIKKHSVEWTFGAEFLNKAAQNTFFHFHIHFSSFTKPDAMRKCIQRAMQDKGFQCSGVKVYSLRPELVVDTAKFYRYPLKQYALPIVEDSALVTNSKGFTVEQLEEMRIAAHAIWTTGVQVQGNKENKEFPDNTLFERALATIKHDGNIKSTKQVLVRLIQFYVDEDRPINVQTIKGYTLTIGLKLGFITSDQLANAIATTTEFGV